MNRENATETALAVAAKHGDAISGLAAAFLNAADTGKSSIRELRRNILALAGKDISREALGGVLELVRIWRLQYGFPLCVPEKEIFAGQAHDAREAACSLIEGEPGAPEIQERIRHETGPSEILMAGYFSFLFPGKPGERRKLTANAVPLCGYFSASDILGPEQENQDFPLGM